MFCFFNKIIVANICGQSSNIFMCLISVTPKQPGETHYHEPHNYEPHISFIIPKVQSIYLNCPRAQKKNQQFKLVYVTTKVM